ncbi:hypothetical protein NicSoilB4_34160 [Arthrobacter sp. NicSoilB4]|nr:hypothetical protein NicSoilB4_34160 [Arthrobacter sp. NicSoilB4]
MPWVVASPDPNNQALKIRSNRRADGTGPSGRSRPASTPVKHTGEARRVLATGTAPRGASQLKQK